MLSEVDACRCLDVLECAFVILFVLVVSVDFGILVCASVGPG